MHSSLLKTSSSYTYSSSLGVSRLVLKKELKDRLQFDDDSVFEHLAVDHLNETFVKLCHCALKANQEFLNSKERYETLQTKAEKEYENKRELADSDSDSEGDEGKDELMGPLGKILSLICAFSDEQKPKYKRKWVNTNGTDFVLRSPDFILCDLGESGESPEDERLWRHRSAFLELKATRFQGIKGAKESTVTDTTSQVADYARLHMSGRPFQLFSIGLVVFGSQFSVCIFDRDGARFSPVNHLWNDMQLFIWIIHRLTFFMSPVQLGQDPNVTIPRNDIATLCRQYAASLTSSGAVSDYPTYSIRFKNATYYTIGHPIWTADSLFGRGTTVWRVSRSSRPTPSSILIMKTSWRRGGRLAESDIYRQIVGEHDGLAQFLDGTDVVFMGQKITSMNLRHPGLANDETKTTILHRLFLKTDGRPLWEFDSLLDFFLGLKAALQGHEFLVNQGILHGDVSAGNILLSLDPNAPDPEKGFLIDLEFARPRLIENEEAPAESNMKTEIWRTQNMISSAPREAVPNGTVQFMACELLESVLHKIQIEHEVHHDVESFIWVIHYAILRRIALVRRSIREMEVTESIQSCAQTTLNSLFGQVNLEDIVSQRHLPVTWHERVPSPPFFTKLFGDIYNCILNSRWRPVENCHKPNHADLYGILDLAIQTIRQPCVQNNK